MKNKKNKFFKKSLSRKTILITVSVVVQKKYVKKQTVKIGESYSFFERPFLHQTTPKIASTSLHKKDMTKLNLKNKKSVFIFMFFHIKQS